MTAQTLALTYKHKNTIIKYFITINPQGTVSFISKGWGEKASDKFIIKDSQILGNLSYGDTVTGDCGFSITKTLSLFGPHLKIPEFSKRHSRLTPTEVE